MAKSLLRLEARKLRKRGISVKKIARYLNISKSTASMWVRDIILTVEQLEDLRGSMIKGQERGRLKNALMQKEKRLLLIEQSKNFGIDNLANITSREYLIAGLSLYWGEGSKKKREVSFCNSDPKMVQFLTHWLENSFNVSSQELRCIVGINEIHKEREQIVKDYWSNRIKISLSQFRKTSFKKIQNKKIYENFYEHYGTLTVKVAKSGQLYYKILGLIEGLYENMPG